MNIPSSLGGFQISERLGAGAMGTVYRAVQSSLGRVVVIKTLHPHLAADQDLIARFEREARHAAHLQHQNTVQVIEFGQDQEVHYIAMEYVEGMDLKQILQLRGPFPIPIAMLVLRDVCRGLEAAHSSDIIHRDIKPANLMITLQGVVKVMDFGLARETAESSTLTAAGSVMGSPAYMSPEQARGETVDPLTDVFSTGLVGYEILSGTRAFGGDSYPLVLHRVLNEEIAPLGSLRPDIPLELLQVIESMTKKEWAARCPSISEARDQLEAMVKQLSLKREDAILGEFARAALLEKELQDPRPKISEARSTARTVTSASSGTLGDGTVVVGDSARTGATARAATAVESGPHPRTTESPRSELATARTVAGTEGASRHGGDAPGRRELTKEGSSRVTSPQFEDPRKIRTPNHRRLQVVASSLGALILLGALTWFLLRPDPNTQSDVGDRAQIESNHSDDGSHPSDGSGQEGPADEMNGGTSDHSASDPTDDPATDDLSESSGDRGTDAGSDPVVGESPETNLTESDPPDSRRTDGADGRDRDTRQTDPADDRTPSDNTGNSRSSSADNPEGRTGTEQVPATPFRQEYSISTFPGFAFIRVDGELINEDGIIPVRATLREGAHAFQLTRSNGEDLGTLQYTVARNDPNRVLVLKFEERMVEARVR